MKSNMLTAKRLVELGFKRKTEKETVYFENDKLCLFLTAGVWALGSNYGALATSNIYIETEEELIKFIKESK